MKKTVVLAFIASFVAVLMFSGDAARAISCFVPTATYPMIQDAVNDPNCTTIFVAPGLYNESVTIGRPLTLDGPNMGTSWSGARGPEAVVTSAATTFNLLDGMGVTIDGFTINGDFGVYVSGSTDGTLIQNNIVTGATRALTFDAPGNGPSALGNDLISNVRSLHVSGGPYTNMKLNVNRFSGPAAATGIFFSGNLANTITGFEFKNNQVKHLANMASSISNGTVSGNTFNVVSPGAYSIVIDLHNSTVSGNSFDGSNATACFRLFGSEFGEIPSDHVLVTTNTFQGCDVYGVQLGPDVDHITVTNNALANGFDGVRTRLAGDVPALQWDVTGHEIHINLNNITGNTEFGVNNQVQGTLDAECNWWGSASGPGPVGTGTGDRVSTNVDFTPWLIAPAPSGRCLGGAPSTPGKVTGGGQVAGDDPVFSPLGDLLSLPALTLSSMTSSSKATFGLSVRCCPEFGNIDYNDHDAGVRIKAQSIDQLIISGPLDTSCPTLPGAKHAFIHGTASVIRSSETTNETFTVDVDDCGEPGTNDTFGIKAESYQNGPSKLLGGNIQIH